VPAGGRHGVRAPGASHPPLRAKGAGAGSRRPDCRRSDGTAADGGLPVALQELADAGRKGPAFLLTSGEADHVHLVTEPDAARLAAAIPPDRSAAWAALDVSVLHTYLITSLWGLPDDVEHVAYEHDVEGALAAAARTGGTAVLLNPTPVEAVAQVAGSGERMPRKSTLFTPKPRTGMVIRDHQDA
jgi:hypothetical protein